MKIWIIWIIFTLIYLSLNAVGLFLKGGVPGMISMIGWGCVMPVLMIAGWWIIVITNRAETGKWWLIGILSTGAFSVAGIITIKIISNTWASI